MFCIFACAIQFLSQIDFEDPRYVLQTKVCGRLANITWVRVLRGSHNGLAYLVSRKLQSRLRAATFPCRANPIRLFVLFGLSSLGQCPALVFLSLLICLLRFRFYCLLKTQLLKDTEALSSPTCCQNLINYNLLLAQSQPEASWNDGSHVFRRVYMCLYVLIHVYMRLYATCGQKSCNS